MRTECWELFEHHGQDLDGLVSKVAIGKDVEEGNSRATVEQWIGAFEAWIEWSEDGGGAERSACLHGIDLLCSW